MKLWYSACLFAYVQIYYLIDFAGHRTDSCFLLQLHEYPTILFYPAGKKSSEPVSYYSINRLSVSQCITYLLMLGIGYIVFRSSIFKLYCDYCQTTFTSVILNMVLVLGAILLLFTKAVPSGRFHCTVSNIATSSRVQ